MRNGIIRFGALYVFDVAVLLLVGLLLPQVQVGLHALWAAVVLTLAALFVKPTLRAALRRYAAKSAADRTKAGEKVVQYVLVYLVELIVWVLTVWLSGVRVSGFFWGYVLPPLFLLVGWVVYDQVDDVLRRRTGEVYDAVQTRVSGTRRPETGSGSAADSRSDGTDAAASASRSEATSAARQELDDGLTPEQRRMLDGL